MPMAELIRAVLRTAAPATAVLLAVAAAGLLDWQVAAGIWAATLLLGAGAALVQVRDAARLVRWIRAMRDGETGAHADVLSGGLRELSRHLAQLESEVGRVRAGSPSATKFIHPSWRRCPAVMTLTPNGRVTTPSPANKIFEKRRPVMRCRNSLGYRIA